VIFSHGADGSVFYYRCLAEHLGPDRPVYAIQASTSGKLPASAEEMAARYVADVKALQPRGPYFLGGYCMGGTVAFEMARQLRSAGEEVGLLALVDTYDWSRIAPGPGPEQLAFLAQKLVFHQRNVLLLPSRERGIFLREKARWGTGLVSEWRTRREARESAAYVYRLLSEYTPGFYPGPLIHFRSREVYSRYRDRELSAGVHAASIEVEEVAVYPGGILVEPFVRRLAERIRVRLDAAA
jgi:pimeloyl-ACP methyl ester carboxylesterase